MNKTKATCKCPFCQNELTQGCLEPVFCKPCRIEFIKCKKCGTLYNKKLKNCPDCNKNKPTGGTG